MSVSLLLAEDVNPVPYFLFGVLLFLVSLFMILLVLIQRGKGGGLTGALGGQGGQSAFGAKVGDTMTYVTIGAAGVWMLLCCLSIKVLSYPFVPPETAAKKEQEKEGEAASSKGTKAGDKSSSKGSDSEPAMPDDTTPGKEATENKTPPSEPKPETPAEKKSDEKPSDKSEVKPDAKPDEKSAPADAPPAKDK